MSLIALQSKLGLKPDGVFGPVTLLAAQKYFRLSDPRAAHFFGQTSHETAEFKYFTENLNYSVSGLTTVFKKYFPTAASAKPYANKPERIANKVYANRMGNGPESSGDGWKYRGRGALQLTGKSNYQEFSSYMKNPAIMSNPDLVSTMYSFESALFFFDKNDIWEICDRGITRETILEVTKKINGGTNGLEDRSKKTRDYFEILYANR